MSSFSGEGKLAAGEGRDIVVRLGVPLVIGKKKSFKV